MSLVHTTKLLTRKGRRMSNTHPDRLCTCSPSARLKAVSHNWDHYNSVTKYRCNSCDKSVDVVPLSHIGYTLTVGVLAIAFGIYIFIFKSWDSGFWTYTIFAGLILFQLYMTASQYAPHHRYPLKPAFQDLTPPSPPKGLRSRIESLGFVGGLLLPIGFVVLVLGAAIVLGIIHDHFYPPP